MQYSNDQDEMIHRNQSFVFNSSLDQRLDEKKDSKITQYFNISNQSFQNSEKQNKIKPLQTDRSHNINLQLFSSFPQQKPYENKNYYLLNSSIQQGFFNNKRFNVDKKLSINPTHQNFKQSKVQESLQKAFCLNRNSQRIPFKKKQNSTPQNYFQQSNQNYKFYQAEYEDYYLKENKKFWIESFQKFYQKRGSMQNLDFPSFHNKDQIKSSIQQIGASKKDGKVHKQNPEKTNQLSKIIVNMSLLNKVILIALFIGGLIFYLNR